MPFYQIDGITPVVSPESFVHPTAVIIGDVIIGKNVYIGPNASLRGDFGRLIIKEGANVQDNCVMHGFPQYDTIIEENGHIGHGAILHGCQCLGWNEQCHYGWRRDWREFYCWRLLLCESRSGICR